MYRTLAKSIREFRKPAIKTMLVITLEVAMEILIPYLMAQVLDRGFANRDIPLIIKLGLIMFVIAMISMLFGALGGKYSAESATGFAKNLRQDMYENIQSFSFANIDKFSTASLITRLTTDITNVQMAFQMVMRTLVRAPLMFIFSFIMSFYINRKLALSILIIMPILAIILVMIVKTVHPIFVKVFKKYDRLNQTVQENITGIRVVKSFVREPEEIAKFKDSSEDVRKYFSRAERILALNSPAMQAAMYTSMLVIYWIGAKQIVGGNMSTGELTSLITYVMQLLGSLMMLSMVFAMITISEASVERIAEVLNETTTLANPPQPLTTIKNGEIEFKNVCFKYNVNSPEYDLKNISFKIKSGETIGIIGGTGSGKSSLIQLIPRLYDTDHGEVLVAGENVKKYDLTLLRDTISMVLQKNTLFSGTINSNLRWGDEQADQQTIEYYAQLAQADSFIQAFPDRYNSTIEQGGNNVSGGQKQRLTIARALLKRPKILILDDSTSAVDTKTDSLIRQAFKKQIPDTTKIIVAQRVSSIEDADRIIVLDEGAITGIGTHEELLKSNAIYQEVYESQQKGASMNEA